MAVGLTAASIPLWLTKCRPSPSRPDIVLIMADDLGFSDIGCYGGEIHTPNLDSLAQSGIRFTQFYNCARCCPTRASLLTGLYPHQTGVGLMMNDLGYRGYRGDLNKTCVTIAEALKQSGYSTYMSGKWHLTKHTKDSSFEEKFNWPLQRGFDRFFGTITGAGNYFAPATLTRDNEPIEAPVEGFYYTDAISDEAVQFIDAHHKRKPDKPFFLYVAYTAPHWPLHALEEDIAKYEGIYMKGWDRLRKERHDRMVAMGLVDEAWPLSLRDPNAKAWEEVEKTDLPEKAALIPHIHKKLKAIMAHKMAVYAAMVDRMDQGIGRIIGALKKTGRFKNTLIFFLSDNGACAEYGALGMGWKDRLEGRVEGARDTWASYGLPWANASNTPFRFYKHWVYEGGIATPLIVHWPEKIKARGELCHQPGHVIDILPTCLDAAGASYPKSFDEHVILPPEGQSLCPVFSGESLGDRILFWEHHGNRAIRMGKWKLVANGEKGAWELYDLDADRTELHNLSRKEFQRVNDMSRMWRHWAQRCHVFPINPHLKKRKRED
ncbi:MAG: arylsulfatase [Deltaproteobacteria bacterium]|nr:arylsulfatase [Deltaproteobacteria bacterium]